MQTPKEIYGWLANNLGPRCLAPLCSGDEPALLASVMLVPLLQHGHGPKELLDAYRVIVQQIQPHCRHFAYHAIAINAEWGSRTAIWEAAGLVYPTVHITCAFEPGGGGQAQHDAWFPKRKK